MCGTGEGAIQKVASAAGNSRGPQEEEDRGGKPTGGPARKGRVLSGAAEQVLEVPKYQNQRFPHAEWGRDCKQDPGTSLKL